MPWLPRLKYVPFLRLTEVNCRIQRTEATLSVLEAKLSSIPGLDLVTLPTTTSTVPTTLSTEENPHNTTHSESDLHKPQPPLISEENDSDSKSSKAECDLECDNIAPKTSDGVLVKDHPVYAKYFRMLHLGVPLQAVVNKFRVENPRLDADLLKTPERRIVIDGKDEDDSGEDDDQGWSQ